MKPGKGNNTHGMTAIELLIVVSLLAIMGGVYVGMVDLTGSALDRGIRRLEADLRFAQQQAMTEEVNYGFLTTGPQSYQIYRGTPGTLATDPHTRQGMAISLATWYAGIRFGGTYQLEFTKDGVPIVGGSNTIVLGLGGRLRWVTVAPTTGLITVQGAN